MWILISSLHVLACLLLICLVLLQQGKGADMGASFGGDSSSLFGPMVENPLKNLTTIVAVVFMSTAVGLAYKSRFFSENEGKLFSRQPAQEAPATTNNAPVQESAENKVQEPAASTPNESSK